MLLPTHTSTHFYIIIVILTNESSKHEAGDAVYRSMSCRPCHGQPLAVRLPYYIFLCFYTTSGLSKSSPAVSTLSVFLCLLCACYVYCPPPLPRIRPPRPSPPFPKKQKNNDKGGRWEAAEAHKKVRSGMLLK